MKTFEEYLKEKHSETYMGTDDSMPEAFYDWLEIIDTDEMMTYADEFKTLFKEVEILNQLKEKLINGGKYSIEHIKVNDRFEEYNHAIDDVLLEIDKLIEKNK